MEVLNNYTITNNGAVFSITPAPLAVVAANKTIIQGGVVQPLLGTIVGLKNGDNITATFVSNTDGLTPGSFAITPVLTDPNSATEQLRRVRDQRRLDRNTRTPRQLSSSRWTHPSTRCNSVRLPR